MTDQNDDSLFNSNDATGVTTPQTTPTEPTGNDGTPSYLEALVGDGKKFKTADDLARGKIEADNFIAKLQAEHQEMREELNKRLAVEEVLKRIEATQNRNDEPSSSQPPAGEEEHGNRGVSKEEIEKLVLSQIEQRDTLKTRGENLKSVKQTLIEKFGPDYQTKVRAKLNALQLGEDFANGLAATQPKAFLELVGVNSATTSTDAPLPKSTVHIGSNTNDARNYEFYKKLRREDPSNYFSTKVQMQMHKDAQEQGESFYN